MTSVPFEKTVETFRADLDDIRRSIAYGRVATQLRPRLGKLIQWECATNSEKALIDAFLNTRPRSPILSMQGFLVVTWATFEKFVRNLIADAVECISASTNSFDDLHEQIVNYNLHQTGVAFQQVFTEGRHLNLDYVDMSARIGTCVPGSKKFKLNTKAMTLFVNNLTTDNLERILKRIHVGNIWDNIGRSAELQRVLKSKRVRETNKLTREYLDELVQKRNAIAHGDDACPIVLESDLEQALEFFGAFGSALSDVVKSTL